MTIRFNSKSATSSPTGATNLVTAGVAAADDTLTSITQVLAVADIVVISSNVVALQNGSNAQEWRVYQTASQYYSTLALGGNWYVGTLSGGGDVHYRAANHIFEGTGGGTVFVLNQSGSYADLSGTTWVRNSPGRTRLTADVTNATASLSNLSDLTQTLVAGRKYTGRLVIKCTNSVAAEGIQFDFNGGGATMTSFWATVGVQASGGTDTLGTNIATSLSGVLNYTTLTGETVLTIELSMVVNAGGTFIPRFAENTHATGTATARLGSYLWLDDSSN